MNFKDFDIKVSYKSVGEQTISSIINPLLGCTKFYKRSVGFFSSSALDFISDGLLSLAKNGGKIFLATSPQLSEEDIIAIKNGYSKRELYKNRFISEFTNTIITLEDDNLELLSDLISEEILDIKIVMKPNGGMYHDKLAVLTDFDDNVVVFTGSNNESRNGFNDNYEKIRTFKSWFDYEGHVQDESEEIESIWNNSNEFLEVYEFNDAIKNSIIQVRKYNKNNIKKEVYNLREYQKEARNSWVSNGYKGFFVMATGTGKTITALYSIKELLDKKEVFTVIAVPYIHLVSQWYEDVIKIMPNCQIIKAYSAITTWDSDIINSIYYNKYHEHKRNIIVITTIKSLSLPRFDNAIKQISVEKLLVVDEAHNFINKIYDDKYKFQYMLGLSATPVFGKDKSKTDALVNFFGGEVYSLPIEKAIGNHLVNYEYHPLYAFPTLEEEEKFNYYSKKMASCFKDGKLIDKDTFVKVHRARLRCISMIQAKIDYLPEYIDKINRKDHFIVYCSDGKVLDENNEKRHIQYAIDILNEKGYKPSKFTASENMDDRIRLINDFNSGYISSLVAIRCLDEGINIPSIETALILSSNDNYREFVQRRGRILRKYGNKKCAYIYDVIVLPSLDCKGMAQIELRRFYEYAKLAINSKELLVELDTNLSKYNLKRDDILFDIDDFDDVVLGGELLDD